MKRRALLLAAAAVVGSLAGLSVSGRADRAAAGTTGASPGVFVVGRDVEFGSLGALAAGGAATKPVATTASATIVAINADATKAVAIYPDDGHSSLDEFDARTGGEIGGFSSPAGTFTENLEGLAMDPNNPGIAYSIANVNSAGTLQWQIDRIDLNARTQTFLGSLPTINYFRLAISPDGSTLFAGGGNANNGNELLAISISNPKIITRWSNGAGGIDDLAVSPDGSTLYVIFTFRTHSLFGFPLPLKGGAALPPIQARLTGNSGGAVTVSPDGQRVYAATYSRNAAGPSTLEEFAPDGTFETSVQIPIDTDANNNGGVQGISVSPDGSTLLAFGVNPPGTTVVTAAIFPVALPSLKVGNPDTTSMTFTGGPQDIAITPDQAPHASITPTSATGCTQFHLDASGSSIVYGSIVSYAWNFGDGHIATTSTPTVPHTYAAGGTYTVTVTETDSAGTSLPPAVAGTSFAVDGPGQTPYKRASSQAQTSIAIPVSPCGTPPPPTTTPTTVHHNTTTTTKPTKKLHPKLTVTPVLGPPGTIVTIKGTGFQAGVPVTVTWSVSTGSIVVTPDSHNNFTTSLPILVPDVLGPRFAQASSSPTVKTKFLVVEGTAEPGGSHGSYLFRSEGQ